MTSKKARTARTARATPSVQQTEADRVYARLTPHDRTFTSIQNVAAVLKAFHRVPSQGACDALTCDCANVCKRSALHA